MIQGEFFTTTELVIAEGSWLKLELLLNNQVVLNDIKAFREQEKLSFTWELNQKYLWPFEKYVLKAQLLDEKGQVYYQGFQLLEPLLDQDYTLKPLQLFESDKLDVLVYANEIIYLAVAKLGDKLLLDRSNSEFLILKSGQEANKYLGEHLILEYEKFEPTLYIKKQSYTLTLQDFGLELWHKAKRDDVLYRGFGQEPGWLINVYTDGSIFLLGDYGQLTLNIYDPHIYYNPCRGQIEFIYDSSFYKMHLEIFNLPSSDIMSGEVFPQTFYLRIGDFQAWGGGRLLQSQTLLENFNTSCNLNPD